MLTLKISGANSPEKLKQVEELLPGRPPYRKGTDPEWYVNFPSREWLDLAQANLNQLPGIKTQRLEFTGSPDQPTSL